MANFYKKSSQLGRSMIEMLGVLSIIGVLSIAGIAAYSAAMFKLQLTKQSEAFSLLLNNAIAILPELQREYGKHMSDGTINAAKIMADAEMLPDGIFYNKNNNSLFDLLKTTIGIYYTGQVLNGRVLTEYSVRFNIDRGENKATDRALAICRNIAMVVKESAGTIFDIQLRSYNSSSYGRDELRGKKLREAGPSEIDALCRSCDSVQQCTLTVFISALSK